MYEKIICRNGQIILLSDINEKISYINDLNLIDIANIENEIEQLGNEEKRINSEISLYKKNLFVNKLLFIFIAIIFIGNLFSLITSGVLEVSILVSIIPFSTIYFYSKRIYKELNANYLTLEYLKKLNENLNTKKDNLKLNPQFAFIREGQEFELKNPKGLHNVVKVLRTYYKMNKLVHKKFSNNDLINLHDNIYNEFLPVFNECNVGYEYRDIVVDEIYKNIVKERKIKHR